jgi:hypothetical protein
MSVSYHHRGVFVSLLAIMACGSSKATAPPPPPVVNGTIFFALTNCPSFTSAEYVADSVTLGSEAIVQGVTSNGYTVPSGLRSAKALLKSPSSIIGTWTYNDRVNVPENGTVTAHPHC